MSASILWEPVNISPDHISCYAPSAFMAAMERAGMGLPCTLNETHIPILRGMAAASDAEPNPYKQIIDLLLNRGSIRLWAEY